MLFVSINIIKIRFQIFYNENKKRMFHFFNSTTFDIHIICDVWIFFNYLIFFDVVIHFVDEKNNLRTLFLIFREFINIHNEKNMIVIILAVLNEYFIRNKFDYFVMNNVQNNDTMLNIISKILRKKHNIEYDFIQHRFRCMNHIINFWASLIAKNTFYLQRIGLRLLSRTVLSIIDNQNSIYSYDRNPDQMLLQMLNSERFARSFELHTLLLLV